MRSFVPSDTTPVSQYWTSRTQGSLRHVPRLCFLLCDEFHFSTCPSLPHTLPLAVSSLSICQSEMPTQCRNGLTVDKYWLAALRMMIDAFHHWRQQCVLYPRLQQLTLVFNGDAGYDRMPFEVREEWSITFNSFIAASLNLKTLALVGAFHEYTRMSREPLTRLQLIRSTTWLPLSGLVTSLTALIALDLRPVRIHQLDTSWTSAIAVLSTLPSLTHFATAIGNDCDSHLACIAQLPKLRSLHLMWTRDSAYPAPSSTASAFMAQARQPLCDFILTADDYESGSPDQLASLSSFQLSHLLFYSSSLQHLDLSQSQLSVTYDNFLTALSSAVDTVDCGVLLPELRRLALAGDQDSQYGETPFTERVVTVLCNIDRQSKHATVWPKLEILALYHFVDADLVPLLEHMEFLPPVNNSSEMSRSQDWCSRFPFRVWLIDESEDSSIKRIESFQSHQLVNQLYRAKRSVPVEVIESILWTNEHGSLA